MDNATSTAAANLPTGAIAEPLRQLVASVAFVLKVATTSVAETHRKVLSITSSTSSIALATADTSLCALDPQITAQLDSILERVRDEIVEDGMTNTITMELPRLVASHYRSVLPAIAALTDGTRTSAAVTAELLKEVGRVRDAISHFDRRWLLEHALSSPNPAARDGAGVGLAWLRDPRAAESLRAAVAREAIPQLKADLEEVLRILARPNDNAIAPQDNEA